MTMLLPLSDPLFDYLYLFIAMAAIGVPPLVISSRLHIRTGGLVALATACTIVAAILVNLLSFLLGELPFTPLGKVLSSLPAAITGLFVSLARLLPFPSASPRFKKNIRLVLSLLALVALLFAAKIAIVPLLAHPPRLFLLE